MKFRYYHFTLFLTMVSCCVWAQQPVLKAATFKVYIDSFNSNDNELYKQYYPNSEAWSFLAKNIPLFNCPDKQLEATYYFRWWTYRKHIKETPDGFVITEFLPAVDWAGKHNTINCAAGHHIYEGRWLHDSSILKDYIHFWFTKGGNIRSYSTWVADALFQYQKVKGDFTHAKNLLPDLVNNFAEWEKSNGSKYDLFWSNDDRDGMEMSVSGSGLRPTLNSYLYGDAMAISNISAMSGNNETAQKFLAKAQNIKQAVQEYLWDKGSNFFKVIPMNDKNDEVVDKGFENYGNKNVRELLGYTPWYMNMVDTGYAIAWKQVLQKGGFDAPFGLTTTEQQSPSFNISYKDHECQWNGPSWPFSTSITLTGLSNLLHNQTQPYITKNDYFSLLRTYSNAHARIKEDGKKVHWIDENLHPYTGDWISRTRLKTWRNNTWDKEKGGIERGKDYNHSTFCDLVISGLIGIQPQVDNRLVVDPLVPDNTWDYFCLDNLLYHGKIVTVLYDKTGKQYKRGKGFKVFLNGVERASAKGLQKLSVILE